MADDATCPELVHLNVGPGWWPCGKPVAHSVLATSGRWEPRCDYHGMSYPEDRRRSPSATPGNAQPEDNVTTPRRRQSVVCRDLLDEGMRLLKAQRTERNDQWVRDLPPGTRVRSPFDGDRSTLSHHTDLDDGWWLADGSWLRWNNVPEWLEDCPDCFHRLSEHHEGGCNVQTGSWETGPTDCRCTRQSAQEKS